MKKKLIIFDLDGVLLDSEENMRLSWKSVMKKYNIKKDFLMYRKYIGLPFQEILLKLKITKKNKEIEQTYNDSSIKYFNSFKLFQGVKKTLAHINKNYFTAIITSKHKKRTNLIIKKNKLKIKTVITPQDNCRVKPYPDSIFKVMRIYNIKNKKDVIYVGDTKIDLKMSTNAKVNYIQANYGFFKLNIKNKINNFLEMHSVLKKINF